MKININGIFRSTLVLILSALTILPTASIVSADGAEEQSGRVAVLKDVNGDSKVSIAAFGDSLTYGVGDGTLPGQDVTHDEVPFTDGTQGYPKRLQALLSVPVSNRGIPGEAVIDGGILRIAGVAATDADVITFMQGINDARRFIPEGTYEMYVQKAINIIRAYGKVPVLATLPKPCCDNEVIAGISESYSNILRRIAAGNEIQLADLAKAWETTCNNKEECELYNLPEGLHPNSLGYAVIAQTFAAALYGIDIFSAEGAQQLADSTGRTVDSIVVKPSATPPPASESSQTNE